MSSGGSKSVIAVLAVVLGVWLSASAAQAYVFGKDDRIPLPGEYAHLKNKIGFLYTRTGNYGCTASCVAKDTILTAAHCVLGGRGKRPAKPQADLKFYLPSKYLKGYYDAADALHGGDYLPRNVFTGAGGSRTFTSRNINSDWAYVKLATNACKGGSLTLKSLPMGKIAEAAKTGKLLEVAFHGDRDFGKTLLFTNTCPVQGVSSNQKRKNVAKTIRHTCDLTPGASGSPLLMDVDGELSIVGLNVAQRYTQRYLRRGKKIIKYYKRKATHNLAVHPSVFIRYLAQIAPAKLVTSTRRLEWIQRGLKERKLYSGKIDGVFGPATRNAIRRFEQSVAQPVLGMPTLELLDRIKPSPPETAGNEGNENKTKSTLTEIEQLRAKRRTLWGAARNAITLEIHRKAMERVTAIQNEWKHKNAHANADTAKPPKP